MGRGPEDHLLRHACRVTAGVLRQDGPHAQPTGPRDVPLPAPARGQPRRLVAVVRRGLRGGTQERQTGAAQRRVLQLPLVSCDGARVLRGRGDRRLPQRPLRQHQGRPRGAARRRCRLYGGRAGRHRAGWVADDRVSHAGRRALLLRYLFSARAPARDAVLPAGAGGGAWCVDRPAGRGRRGGGEDRAGPRRAGDLVRRRAGARRGGAGGGAARADAGVRPATRRVRWGAEVPAVHGRGVPAAPSRPDRGRGRLADGDGHMRADGAWRDLRPAGGGFARYSVDREWVVPHFEKMLYDNALLCRVYAHLWRATGSELARRVALETADFMVRELRTNEGGFASALDADSDDGTGRHVEGRTTRGRPRSSPRCWASRMPSLPRSTSG